MYKFVRLRRKQRDHGSKFRAACFTFIDARSVVTGCFLGGMNTDIKSCFLGLLVTKHLLLNMPAKDIQETAKATRRALLYEYLDKVSTMTVPSNIFEFWQERRREFPAFFTLSTHTLRVPASSAPVKRILSPNGLKMRPQRARLSSEMLEILVYLKCNCNFLENKKIDSTWCHMDSLLKGRMIADLSLGLDSCWTWS